MTNLSDAAQAVLTSSEKVSYDWGNMSQSHHTVIAAAALRAAADQVEPDDGVSSEVRRVLDRLLAIAAELEEFGNR